MNNDLTTIDLSTGSVEDVSTSGLLYDVNTKQPESKGFFGRVGQIAGMVFLLGVTPATAIEDYWFVERRRNEVSSTILIFEGIIGKPITFQQARQMALKFLHDIENQRLITAITESNRYLEMEDIS